MVDLGRGLDTVLVFVVLQENVESGGVEAGDDQAGDCSVVGVDVESCQYDEQ